MLLSAVFSVSVSAEDIEVDNTMLTIRTLAYVGATPDVNNFVVYLNDDTIQTTTYTYENGIPKNTQYFNMEQMLTLQYEDGEPLFKKDRNSKITLHNAFLSMYISNTDNKYSKYDRDIEQVRLLLHYTDGSTEYIDDVVIEKPTDGLFNFTVEFNPGKDVAKAEFVTFNQHKLPTKYSTDSKVEIHVGEVTDPALALSITIQSEEAGLLTSVIEWLKGIKEGITGVFNTLKELPSVLWNYIQNGLQRLFTPSEDFIVTFKDDMDSMLSDKLGAVYEVVDITFDSWDSIKTFDETNTINFPSATINLGKDSFTFGGYTVQIVPDGFDIIVGVLKSIIGIVCTVAFVNGLRKRYDELMGVEK